ncbi:MAG: YkgJ family cysteine cluster protein [Marinilabiliales bacterium]|nr:MAG: YkgJ family cysteine cluster protein [Marinilabiliales bacterium]
MKPDYSATLKKLRKLNTKKLDSLFHELHDQAFEHIDCLECANCCKSLGPRLSDIDIKRLATHLKIKESDFITEYLRIDEDKDYVFKSMPCPFLMDDNYCIVYKSRPKACREYTHTNQKNIKSILSTCVKNIPTCPVVE